MALAGNITFGGVDAAPAMNAQEFYGTGEIPTMQAQAARNDDATDAQAYTFTATVAQQAIPTREEARMEYIPGTLGRQVGRMARNIVANEEVVRTPRTAWVEDEVRPPISPAEHAACMMISAFARVLYKKGIIDIGAYQRMADIDGRDYIEVISRLVEVADEVTGVNPEIAVEE